MMNRRRFLYTATTGLAMFRAATTAAWAAYTDAGKSLVFNIDEHLRIGVVPRDVMGLSYETTQLGEPEFFAPENKALVKLLRTLSPTGSLRLGGNTVEFTYFKANDSVSSPAWSPLPTQPKTLTPITPKALRNLRGFLDATGWTCIYSLNLGTGTPERAAEEAEAVTKILGPKLDYLQIGNEPNNYIRYKLRPNTWNEKVYLAEWLPFAHAILKRVPTAKLGGPDMGAEAPCFKLFASDAVADLKEHLVAITDHFYAEGPPTSPESTMETLLFKTKKIDHEIDVTASAGHAANLPYRMTEVNSCYSGGKPGVSNTLGSALWAGDLTLKLVSAGFSGINFHGGSARQIRASLGGVMPGDSVAKAEADDSYYTPIAGTAAAGYKARPIFYGMLMAARMAGAALLKSSFGEEQNAVTGYAGVQTGGTVQAALFNKGSEPVDVVLHLGKPCRAASAMRLTGPAVDATDGILFGKVAVEGDGRWAPNKVELLKRTPEGSFKINMPPASAALVSIRPL